MLRQGGPGLKATQEYPLGFGRRLRSLHENLKDCFCAVSFGSVKSGEERKGLHLYAKVKAAFEQTRKLKLKRVGPSFPI